MVLPEGAGKGSADAAACCGESGGWCARCGIVHTLPSALVLDECRQLMAALAKQQRIDGLVPGGERNVRCTTASLFGPAGGKMFGMLACRDAAGRRVVLRAFSGQYNGLWEVPGWVGPIFEVSAWTALVAAPDREIKALGREMQGMSRESSRYRSLRRKRKHLSQHLMREIHGLYRLSNFRGESAPLTRVFAGPGLPPAGTGDCCGPKLLHHAACNGLQPEAMAEFYWGRPNHSGTRQHGCFYPACAAKCRPLLGFQLCGLP